MEIFEILKQITQNLGVSGRENELDNLKKVLGTYCDECFYDNANTLHGVFGHTGEPIMLDAHADRIGMLVLSITDDGFLKVGKCGGIDIRTLPAARVVVHGKKMITGVITSVPPHLIDSKSDDADSLDKLYIDVGMTKDECEEYISIGDYVTVENDVIKMTDTLFSGSALDDRVGCLSILLALDILKQNNCDRRVIVSFSSMEEVGGMGAGICAFSEKPSSAVAVDVSFATQNGVEKDKSGELGKGAMICISPSISYEMSKKLIEIAKENNIDYQLEVCSDETGTNADEIARSRGGVKTGLVSIPQKNMHTQAEICNINDIESVAKILAQYILSEEKNNG